MHKNICSVLSSDGGPMEIQPLLTQQTDQGHFTVEQSRRRKMQMLRKLAKDLNVLDCNTSSVIIFASHLVESKIPLATTSGLLFFFF